jgi:putative FmdB family regulatory protein
MPTYVYACDSCGKQFEKFQSFKEDPLKVCPCGQEGQVRRVIQPAGIVFKGSGWYITDSRGGSNVAVSSETPAKESDAKGSTSEKADTTTTSTTAEPATPAAPAPAATPAPAASVAS